MIETQEQALAEAKRRKWLHPILLKHPYYDRFFVCAELGGKIFGHGDTWDEAFADADKREGK